MATTKDIRTSPQDTICDVCGRTLLRGEQADMYLDGPLRRAVCELCKDRALHAGWVREGTITGIEDAPSPPDRRRSLLSRLWGRREASGSAPPAAPTLRDDLDGHAWSTAAEIEEPSAPAPDPEPARDQAPPRRRRLTQGRERQPLPTRAPREPRHVRAVPTENEHKVAAAVERFNESEHTRTVAGVARSLGAPVVAVIPSPTHASQVSFVVSWELCWYRYEVDLSDEVPSVRSAGQGYELTELSAQEREGNAVADERGTLQLTG